MKETTIGSMSKDPQDFFFQNLKKNARSFAFPLRGVLVYVVATNNQEATELS